MTRTRKPSFAISKSASRPAATRTSFYKFTKGQQVLALGRIACDSDGESSRKVKAGRVGTVLGARASDAGTPEYLVKFERRAGPLNCDETELTERAPD